METNAFPVILGATAGTMAGVTVGVCVGTVIGCIAAVPLTGTATVGAGWAAVEAGKLAWKYDAHLFHEYIHEAIKPDGYY